MPVISELARRLRRYPTVPPASSQIARLAAKPPNDLQKALATAALHLPTMGANLAFHVQRLAAVPDVAPCHPSITEALADVSAHVKAFLGRS